MRTCSMLSSCALLFSLECARVSRSWGNEWAAVRRQVIVTGVERMATFYLGERYEADLKRVIGHDLLMYDARDLTTHAVCVGMTGSGKRGLCTDLLEEAA